MGFDLYPGNYNTLIEKPERPVQKVVAVVGVGAIGAEIGYYLKDALPDSEPWVYSKGHRRRRLRPNARGSPGGEL